MVFLRWNKRKCRCYFVLFVCLNGLLNHLFIENGFAQGRKKPDTASKHERNFNFSHLGERHNYHNPETRPPTLNAWVDPSLQWNSRGRGVLVFQNNLIEPRKTENFISFKHRSTDVREPSKRRRRSRSQSVSQIRIGLEILHSERDDRKKTCRRNSFPVERVDGGCLKSILEEFDTLTLQIGKIKQDILGIEDFDEIDQKEVEMNLLLEQKRRMGLEFSISNAAVKYCVQSKKRMKNLGLQFIPYFEQEIAEAFPERDSRPDWQKICVMNESSESSAAISTRAPTETEKYRYEMIRAILTAQVSLTEEFQVDDRRLSSELAEFGDKNVEWMYLEKKVKILFKYFCSLRS